MTEELRIKIVADTSALKASMTQAKQTMDATGFGDKQAKGAKQLDGALIELKGTMESIKKLNFAGLMSSIFGKKDLVRDMKIKLAKESIKEAKENIKNAFKNGIGNVDFDWKNMRTNLKEALKYSSGIMLDASPAFFQKAINGANDYRKKIKEVRMEVRKSVNEAITAPIRKRVNNITSFISKKVNKMTSSIKSKMKQLSSKSKDFLELMIPQKGFGSMSYFKDDLKTLSKSFKKVGADLKALFSNLGKLIMAQLGAILAVVGVIVATVALWWKAGFNVARQTKEIAMNASKIGMSVASYQKWGYVLENVGVEADNLIDFIKSLSSEQAEVVEGNEDAIKSFEKLGLSAEKIKSMNQEELFEETVKGLQNVENQVERTALAYKIFGEEDAANLANILRINNKELEQMKKNYELLGGYSSKTLTSGSLKLQSSLQNLRVAWQGLRNVLAEAVLPELIAITQAIVKATAGLRMFFAVLFNTDQTPTTNKAEGSMDDYKGSIDGAIKSAEKLKRTVMGFDELNIVGNPKAPDYNMNAGMNGNGSAGIGSLLPSVEDLGLSGMKSWFEDNKKAIEDWTTVLTVAGGVALLVAGICMGNIPMAIAGAGLAGLGIKIGAGDGGTWERWGTAISDWATGVWESIQRTFGSIGDWFNNNIITPIRNAINSVKEWFSVHISQPIGNFFGKLGKSFKALFDKIKEICSTIGQLFGAVGTAFSVYVLEPIGRFGDWVYEKAIKPVKEWFEKAGEWIYEHAIRPVKEWFDKAGDWIYDHLIKPFVDDVIWLKDWLVRTFKWLGDHISGFIGDGIKWVINGIFGIIEDSINFFIQMLNGAVDIMNKIPGVDIKYIQELQIPRLATGGIATKSTVANVGEAGKEAILPLDRNTQWMDKLAEKIAGRGPSKIILKVDGRELGWATINNINSITKQTGGIQLAL